MLTIREEKIPSQLHETSLFRAKCIQRKRVITDRERLVFAIPGMRHVSYMHRDDATCWANLTSKEQGGMPFHGGTMTPPLHPAFRSHDYIATAMKLRAAIASTLGQAAAERANQTLIRESSKWFHISADEHEAFKEQLDELIAEILADAAAGIDRSSLTFKVHARLDEAAERIGNFQPSPLNNTKVKTFSDAAPRPEWPYRTSFSEDRSVACIKLDGKVLTVDGDFVGDLKALWPWELRKGGTVKKWVPRLARKTLKVTGGVWRPLSHFVLIKKYGNVTQRQMRNAVRFRRRRPARPEE